MSDLGEQLLIGSLVLGGAILGVAIQIEGHNMEKEKKDEKRSTTF